MANYKVVFEGEEQDEVFGSYEEASEYADYLVSCYHTGGETLELSNPGDYPYDPDYEPECEIIETDEPVKETDPEEEAYYAKVHELLSCPGVYDSEGEYIRCPVCGMGLRYYNGEPTCPECYARQ